MDRVIKSIKENAEDCYPYCADGDLRKKESFRYAMVYLHGLVKNLEYLTNFDNLNEDQKRYTINDAIEHTKAYIHLLLDQETNLTLY